MVRDAVAYVGVISLKYGQTPHDPEVNPARLSITELEFNEAIRLNLPIVLFIMSDEHLVRKADIESDSEKREKLYKFRESAKRARRASEVQRIYKSFDSVEQFSFAAAIAIGNLVRHLERQVALDKTYAGSFRQSISNIPINIPFHFVGRDNDIVTIDNLFAQSHGNAITALYGLRGVGKTVLAAAFAEWRRKNYRATWWIRAETESTMRSDLIGLGVQLGLDVSGAPEDQAVAIIKDRLRVDGHDILLIFDNALGPEELKPFLPRGPRIIITSNAPNWAAIAVPIHLEAWTKNVGADFLVARTGRAAEREKALTLSDALGGLPLAHEQAAAYCERVGISLAEYTKRFAATSAEVLDVTQDAPREYRDGTTVAKTFAFAINEAEKRHPSARQLIAYAARLAPEPIPLYFFSEGREKFPEPFSSLIFSGGLEDAVNALRAFGLVDREAVPDERDPNVVTDCIRLHRLVREVVVAKEIDAYGDIVATLLSVLASVYPNDSYKYPEAWPKARRLDAHAISLVDDTTLSQGTEGWVADILMELGAYRYRVLGNYAEARALFERALATLERVVVPDHRKLRISMSFLALVLRDQGDFDGAGLLFQRVLEMNESISGPDHLDTASALNNLGLIFEAQGNFARARPLYERALKIRENKLGSEHRDTALVMGNLGSVLYRQGDMAAAQLILERALGIRERLIGPDNPEISANLLSLCSLFFAQGDLVKALDLAKRALQMDERILGPDHPQLKKSTEAVARVLDRLGRSAEATELRRKFR